MTKARNWYSEAHPALSEIARMIRIQWLRQPPFGAVFVVRPAWARSWRWKFSRELATANEVKRNCVRVTERGKEAWSETASLGHKNWIRGGAEQGERAMYREALVAKAQAA